jgi:hypothetical protein
VTRVLDSQAGLSLHEYLASFLEKLTEIFQLEQDYFYQHFSYASRFEQFRRETEYEVINSRLRPHIIGCGDLHTLCQSIDSFKLPEGIQTKLLGDTVEKLHSDLQERLLLISHYQI